MQLQPRPRGHDLRRRPDMGGGRVRSHTIAILGGGKNRDRVRLGDGHGGSHSGGGAFPLCVSRGFGLPTRWLGLRDGDVVFFAGVT